MGTVLLGGRSGAFTVVRLERNGALDLSFGTDGVATLDAGGGYVVTDVLLLPNGKVLAAGYDGFSVVRFNADGSPDAGFGEGGLFVADLPGNIEGAHALALMEDGDVIVGGMARVDFFDFALARIEMEEAEGLTVVVE